MFKIKSSASFKWPVKVLVPNDGRHVEHSFTGQFKEVPKDRFNDVAAGDAEAEQNLLQEVLIGWDGVADENGEPITFNGETRDTLLQIPYVRNAIATAFFAGIGGRKAKN